ncbi:MAG: major facilitator superfamily domain-containing protein 7 [Chloroflexi bacterium]|nr:MAG: major facilitator superfamily domain-containing protein 7 [Chloroflexota bacterium]
MIGDLAIIFPLVYVVLALPAGRWLDAHFGRALGTGAVLTAAGALIRVAAPTSLAVLVAGQCVIAIAQPLVLNSITKVAARYFPPRERAAAISIGSVALFAGILGAVLLGGPLFDAGGLSLLLAAEAIPALAGGALVLAVLSTPMVQALRCDSRGCCAAASCGRWRAWCSSAWARTTRSPPGWNRSSRTTARPARPAT